MFKNYIFDIDGTLIESQSLVFQSLNHALIKYQYPPLGSKEIALFKRIGLRAFIKKKHLSLYKIALINLSTLKYKYKHLNLIKPISGISETINCLKRKKYFLGVISSNNKKIIKKILELNNLSDFEFIQPAGLFNKAVYLKRILRRYNLVKKDTVYIGDEIRDIEAAHESGIKVAAVTWGINSVKALKKAKADFLIDLPKDLLKLS